MQANIRNLFLLPTTKLFIAHVTLMRIKKIEDEKKFKEILKKYEDKCIGTTDANLELMQSHLHPSGAKYSCIKKFIT